MSKVRVFSNRIPMLSALTAALCLWGCSTDTSPTASNGVEDASIAASEFEPVAFGGIPSGVAAAKAPAGTGIAVSELISAKKGGRLVLDWPAKKDKVRGAKKDKVKIKVEIKILPGALEKDTMISITLANLSHAIVSVDLEFGTSATQFKIPAEVKLHMAGLDLSGYSDEDEINLFWHDPTSQSWFPVRYGYKKVDLKKGKVQGVWFLDHFSRFALGRGR